MWVAQVTEPINGVSSDLNELVQELNNRFGSMYRFSILLGDRPCVICRPVEETVKQPGDEGTEREILQFIITELLRELISQQSFSQMALQEIGLFATPDSMEALQDYVGGIPEDGERIIATTVMGMTWNLACSLVNRGITPVAVDE